MPRQDRPTVPPHLKPMIDSFALTLRAIGRSDRTIEMYSDAVGWLAGELPPDVDWERAAREHHHVRLFLADLTDAGYSVSYRNNIGRCLQAYFKWLAAEEDLPNPFGIKLKVPPPPKPGTISVPILAVEQLGALLAHAERGRSFEDRRDAALLRLFASTGCRLAEVAHLELTDLNLAAREATVTGKGGKVRTVRYDHKAALALDRYLRVRAKHRHAGALTALWVGVRRKTGMTPDGVYQVVKRRGRALGLEIHPHLFRHSFAHRWLDAGGAEGDLMELAGWDSPQMLRHYGASARGARARRAYDRVDVMGGA